MGTGGQRERGAEGRCCSRERSGASCRSCLGRQWVATRAATTIRAPHSSPVLYIRATKRAERASDGTFVRKRTNIDMFFDTLVLHLCISLGERGRKAYSV